MTQQPKVSVLISFYNLAPFVDQTMESVLAQKTDFPVEILCADDGLSLIHISPTPRSMRSRSGIPASV